MKRLFKKQMNKRPNKKRRLLFAVLLGAVLAGMFGIFYYSSQRESYQCKSEATSPLYEEASVMVNRNLIVAEDHELYKKIQEDRGSASDINCLYPMINYNIRVKDRDRTQQLFNLFAEQYGEDRQAAKMFEQYPVRTFEDVEAEVEQYIEGGGNDLIFF